MTTIYDIIDARVQSALSSVPHITTYTNTNNQQSQASYPEFNDSGSTDAGNPPVNQVRVTLPENSTVTIGFKSSILGADRGAVNIALKDVAKARLLVNGDPMLEAGEATVTPGDKQNLCWKWVIKGIKGVTTFGIRLKKANATVEEMTVPSSRLTVDVSS